MWIPEGVKSLFFPTKKKQNPGNYALSAGAVPLAASSPSIHAIAEWTSDVELPLVVELARTGVTGFQGTYAGAIATEAQPTPSGDVVELYVAAVIEYGTGGVTHRRVCDWKAGSYQLPPCTFARVSLAWWNRSGSIAGSGLQLLGNYTAAIAMGNLQSPARMTCTDIFEFAAVGNLSFSTPPGARWLRTAPDSANFATAQIVVASFVLLELVQSLDFVNGVFWPPQTPVEIAPSFFGNSSNSIRLSYNAGTFPAWVTTEFFIEP